MNLSLFYENVTVLDYAFHCFSRGLVGNSLKVHVEFFGHTDDEGILFDFSYAKKKVKEIIDRDCDHRFIVPEGIVKYEEDKAYTHYTYGLEASEIEYWCPQEGICEIPFKQVSYESISTYLETIIMNEMPSTVNAIKIVLEDETFKDDDSVFHYTHGLKDHYGNCQRLFHGHKNTVKIFHNGNRSIDIEKKLSSDLFSGNIHFAFWENIQNKKEIEQLLDQKNPEGCFDEIPFVHIKYNSNQGEFESKLSGKMCYLIQTESTVENLSMHFAKIAKSFVAKKDSIQAIAYEGIAKGAKSTV